VWWHGRAALPLSVLFTLRSASVRPAPLLATTDASFPGQACGGVDGLRKWKHVANDLMVRKVRAGARAAPPLPPRRSAGTVDVIS
jgi:hypothetical protein